ncbi:MAG: L-threonylcarbamoyladenylate synthase [Gaiellaceae bacterium]
MRDGRIVVLPFDTVYGLSCEPHREEPTRRLYRLKGREEGKPAALVAADPDLLFECLPELRGRVALLLRGLLPGPYTLVVPNPARRFRWLTGSTPDRIGVRIPDLPEPTLSIVASVGCVVATSANLAGGPDPRRLDEVPEEIRAGCALAVDGGELPGAPSTVVDLTGPEPVVLRVGAVPAAEALARLSG